MKKIIHPCPQCKRIMEKIESIDKDGTIYLWCRKCLISDVPTFLEGVDKSPK